MAHRYKTYTSSDGTTFHYFFAFSRRVSRPEGEGSGTDYVFVVTPDQTVPFVIRLFVSDRALRAWETEHRRTMESSETYAAAKLRLFRAFDETAATRVAWLDLAVDEANVAELLAPLDL